MKVRGGLGRGLDALLPQPEEDALSSSAPRSTLGQTAQIAIERLSPGEHQPRSRIRDEGIEELAQSIRAQGVIEPIIVRPRAGDRFEIIAGERRWRAAQRAGLATVPAVVREADDKQAAALALIENIQREDLNPLEEARALKRLLDDYALTHEELAEAVGKSRTAVSNLLRLLNLSPAVCQLLDQGRLDMGHARALLPLAALDQEVVARRVIARRLSVRQTERLVRRMLSGDAATEAAVDADARRLERTLSERLGARASIASGKDGKGRIVIRYASLDELDGLLERLGVKLD